MSKSVQFVSYARRSSSGESKQIASIPDQEKALRALVAREGLNVVEWLQESSSAMRPGERPVFRHMMDQIYSGAAGGVLCWHVHRLARNDLEWGEVMQRLRDGVIQCIKTPEREYHPEDHALLIAVEASMAGQYSRDLSREVARGAREKSERGWYPYGPKAGYVVDPVTKEILRDEVRFPLLRAAIDLVLDGVDSPPRVLERLNAMGYRTRRTKNGGDKPMSRTSFYDFLADPFYTGRYMFQGEERLSKHEPLLTDEEFATIRQMLGPQRAKTEKHFHAYAGLIRCGVCGCQVTAETHVKRYRTTGHEATYVYYHCTGRKGCPRASVTEAELDSVLLRELEGRQLDSEFVAWALQVVEREEADDAGSIRQQASITAAERSLTVSIDRLFKMREDDEITKDEFMERKAKYSARLNAARREATRVALAPQREREKLKEALVFRRDAYRRFVGKHPEERRRVARALASDYVLTLGNLTFSVHPGLHKMTTFEPPKSRASQVGQGKPGVYSPVWRAMLDELRKSVSLSNTAAHFD